MPPVRPGIPSPFGNEVTSAVRSDEDVPDPFGPEFVSSPFERADVRAWYMIIMEDALPFMERGRRISGQFTPQQVTHNVGVQLPEAGGFSRLSPIIAWVGGQLETFSFQARLFSEHRDDNSAAEKLEELRELTKPHVDLKRPPLVSFFWGVAIPNGLPCFIESLGGIVYDEIRDDGSLRGVTLTITLKRFEQYRIEQVPISQAEQTPAHEAKHGETYEMVAMHRYGDPLLGVLLRQRNPRAPMTVDYPTSVADLEPGNLVKIFPVREMKREDVKPLCHVLRTDNYVAADNRRIFFESRSKIIATLPRK